MTSTAIEVPAEYAEDFRDAVLIEIARDAGYIKEAAETEQRLILENRQAAAEARMRDHAPPEPRCTDTGDIDGSVSNVCNSWALLGPAWRGEPKIEAMAEVLMHVFETLADKILAPRLGEVVNVSPIDAEQAQEVTRVTDEIGWAVGESARLEALWQTQHAERKAEVAS